VARSYDGGGGGDTMASIAMVSSSPERISSGQGVVPAMVAAYEEITVISQPSQSSRTLERQTPVS